MNDWLKPIFLLLGVFIIIALLIVGMPEAFPEISWSEINIPIIAVLPLLIVFGVALFTLIYVTRRR